MHVIVPTEDLIDVLSRLKPLRSLKTRGFPFSVYTLEAKDGKLQIIISDKTTITASMEIFADVKKPGKISLNGGDFYQVIMKLIPVTRTSSGGSKDIELLVKGNKLYLDTSTTYLSVNASVKQQRTFSLVEEDLSWNTRKTTVPTSKFEMHIESVLELFKTLGRMVSAYTSDIVGLSGILMKVSPEEIKFVVSDGIRLLETVVCQELATSDLELILPKSTVNLLYYLVSVGDILEVEASSQQIRFRISSDGLETLLVSSLIAGNYPDYESVFSYGNSPNITINTKLFKDNIMNVRECLDKQDYLLKLKYRKALTLENASKNSHLTFTNEGLPVVSSEGGPFELIVNAYYLESLLAFVDSENVKLVIPVEFKPLLLYNISDTLQIRAALALTRE